MIPSHIIYYMIYYYQIKVYVGIVNVVFTFISLVLIEKFGRKSLHLLGLTGMMLMAIGLGTLLGFYLESGLG